MKHGRLIKEGQSHGAVTLSHLPWVPKAHVDTRTHIEFVLLKLASGAGLLLAFAARKKTICLFQRKVYAETETKEEMHLSIS